MKCQNCGNSLEDNAKFCTVCGNSIAMLENEPESLFIPNQSNYIEQQTEQNQQIDYSNQNQQPLYYMNRSLEQKSTTTKILVGIVIAVLIFIIASLSNENSKQKYQMNNYQNQISDYQSEIYDYENEGTIEKTLDAAESWLDIIF